MLELKEKGIIRHKKGSLGDSDCLVLVTEKTGGAVGTQPNSGWRYGPSSGTFTVK